MALSTIDTNEPKSYRFAMKIPKWYEAMKKEIRVLHVNKTRRLVPKLAGACCWLKVGVSH